RQRQVEEMIKMTDAVLDGIDHKRIRRRLHTYDCDTLNQIVTEAQASALQVVASELLRERAAQKEFRERDLRLAAMSNIELERLAGSGERDSKWAKMYLRKNLHKEFRALPCEELREILLREDHSIRTEIA